jgi:two-component system, cell cycle sensor histidine kinase and response regulator CckA
MHNAILVADDEPLIRGLVEEILTDAGYPVLLAEDGQQALDVYCANMSSIALVLLDLTMPNLSGAACLRQLKALNPAAKVVLSSGYNEEQEIQGLLAEGASAFIQKPYYPEDFIEVIRHALA